MNDTTANRGEAARLLGVDPTTLDRFVRAGAPVERRAGRGGVESAYSVPALVEWLRAHEREKALARLEREVTAEDLDRLRARKLELEAEALELRNARERGELVSVDELRPVLDALVIGGREAVRLNAPYRIAARAAGGTKKEIRAVATDEIESALANWSAQGLDSALRAIGGKTDAPEPETEGEAA